MYSKLKVGEIMTMPQRVWYKGADYHITERGNHRNDIFRGDEDFQYYLTVIEEALLYYGNHNYQLICYLLMDNHVHLIIKTNDKPLANLMSRISSIYTRYFNKKYNYIGHLLQYRYYLKNAGSVTELCIKTKEEFRFFLELKRLYNEISIESHNIIGVESGIKAFNLDGISIIVNDDMIMSIVDETVIKVCKDDFVKKPIKSIKELLRK